MNNIVSVLHQIPVDDRSVIVYDIDGTLIHNDGRPNHPVIHSYHYAKWRGFQPIIITARPAHPDNVLRTKQQLYQHGIRDYLAIYFMPAHIDPHPNNQANYKLQARQDIHRRGLRVAASIGDMPWDVGQFGGVGIRV